MNSNTTLYLAAAIRDARGVNARPGAVAVREGVILAAGHPDEVLRTAGRPDRTIDLPDKLLLPALINAHTHLDLTSIGPQPYDTAASAAGDSSRFIQWIEKVIHLRPQTPADITQAILAGLSASRSAGTGWIGDIAGSDQALRARAQAPSDLQIPGVTYLECFGLGASSPSAASAAVQRLQTLIHELTTPHRGTGVPPVSDSQLRLELQPHAPYSAGLPIYQAALNPIPGPYHPSTHLAETPEEDQFIRHATGPFADLLRRLGKWDDSIQPNNVSPVQHLAAVLSHANWLVAHCNYVNDEDIAILARTHTSVAYCPVASDYFGHRNHRYRDMLAAGINVCLGTDSILCQPPREPQPLGILPQMRHLYQRDKTDPALLLKMATINGIQALALDHTPDQSPHLATLQPGAPAHLIAITIDKNNPTDPLTQALTNNHRTEPVSISNHTSD